MMGTCNLDLFKNQFIMGRKKAPTKAEKFVIAVNKADYDAINEFAAEHRSKRNHFSFYDLLKNLTEDGVKQLMMQLLKIFTELMKKNFPPSTVIDFTRLAPEKFTMIAQFYQAVSDVGLACIQSELASLCPSELLKYAIIFHGVILLMPDTMDSIKNHISYYCERLYLTGLYENDNLKIFLPNVVLYLVRRTLAKKASKIDVKRMYAIRNSLVTINEIKGPITDQLWPLFVDCATSQTYLQIQEGQKVISYVMALDRKKAYPIHNKYKTFILGVTLKTAKALGNVYFVGWCNAVKCPERDMRSAFEIRFFQDILLLGINSVHKHKLQIVRKILFPFCINKRNREVSSVLLNVYQPVIYLYFKNRSGLRRAASAQFLFDVFPLYDPDSRVVHRETEITEQMLKIRGFLMDEFPIVRITAILGICLSMSVNWEIFPEEMMKTYFRILIDDLSKDSSSAEVRAAVVMGFKCLLENPFAMRSLKNILPKILGLFHDVDICVRIAFCRLLLKVKTISSIKYYDVVAPRHLFARMEDDCHTIKKYLSCLIYNSYFPRNENMRVCIGRCLEIIRDNRAASRVFFTYVSNFIGQYRSVDFMIQSVKAIHKYVKYKRTADVGTSDKENIENIQSLIDKFEEASNFDNANIVGAFMDAIAITWLSLKPHSDKNVMEKIEFKNLTKFLVAKVTASLIDVCDFYKESAAWESAFYLCSFLSPGDLPHFSEMCFAKLKVLPTNSKECDYITLLQCLANQFKMGDVLVFLKDWIEYGLGASYVIPPPNKKRRGRKVHAIHPDEPKPYLANRMLDSILNDRFMQTRALKEQPKLLDLLHLMHNIKRKLERVNARLMTQAEADFLNLLIHNLLRIAVHSHGYPDYKLNASVLFLNEFTDWTNTELIKHFARGEDGFPFTELIFGICQNLCKILSDVIAIGFIEPNNCLYLNFIFKVLHTGFGYKFVTLATQLLYKHSFTSQCLFMINKDKIAMEHHLHYLSKFFVVLNNEAMLKKIPDTEIPNIANAISKVLEAAQTHVNVFKLLSYQVFNGLLKNILDLAAASYEKMHKKGVEIAFDAYEKLEFPRALNFFWSIITRNPKVHRTYINYLAFMIQDSNHITLSYWIAYWMIYMKFLHIKSLPQPAIKEIQSQIEQLETIYRALYPSRIKSEWNSPPIRVPVHSFARHCYNELMRLKLQIDKRLGIAPKNKVQRSKSLPKRLNIRLRNN